jgi:hypothetical protein
MDRDSARRSLITTSNQASSTQALLRAPHVRATVRSSNIDIESRATGTKLAGLSNGELFGEGFPVLVHPP